MLPVEILPIQETIVLRARGSELLILPQHVEKLRGMAKPRDFSQYFRAEALVNRPARKLFEAWLRKDHTLWPRLYQTVHTEMASGDAATAPDAVAPSAKAEPKSAAAAPVATEVAPKAKKDKTTVATAPVVEAKAEKAPAKEKKAVAAAPVKEVKAVAAAKEPKAKAGLAKEPKKTETKAKEPKKADAKAKTISKDTKAKPAATKKAAGAKAKG